MILCRSKTNLPGAALLRPAPPRQTYKETVYTAIEQSSTPSLPRTPPSLDHLRVIALLRLGSSISRTRTRAINRHRVPVRRTLLLPVRRPNGQYPLPIQHQLARLGILRCFVFPLPNLLIRDGGRNDVRQEL